VATVAAGGAKDTGGSARWLFVVTILLGSFLLFLVQPMVARMVLPRLGGAPNVWNSAMVVYQLLLLAGYAYAHVLGRFDVRRQAAVHLAVLALAGLTLPIALAALPPPAPGSEVVWVPALFILTIGPVFFAVSAQAPLMQRWFAAHPHAGEPWPLYAASNFGSFAGLVAYPLLVEPNLPVSRQSLAWSGGYAVLALAVALAAATRWSSGRQPLAAAVSRATDGPRPSGRRVLLWLALSAVPSGLMLSTTTHLTTDLFAMPLLWVIPLGLYLLSMVFAFSANRFVTRLVTLLAPPVMLLAGGMAMVARHSTTLVQAILSVILLFAVSVALHGRLYDSRPSVVHLTRFYLVTAAGGALGGAFTALLAPELFDWSWEHPLLVIAAAILLPLPRLYDWRRMPGLEPEMIRLAVGVVLLLTALLGWFLLSVAADADPGPQRLVLTGGIGVLGLLLVAWRVLFLAVLAMLLIVQGGAETIASSFAGSRTRSYFGIYTVRDYPDYNLRILAHGTTLHGEQSTIPGLRDTPISYYGRGSGVAIALRNAQRLYGRGARIGVLGLGVGTLACFHQPGERWTFFEIDPVVLRYSRDGTFTYLRDCAPDARVIIGDARLELAKVPPGSIDILAMDAFTSDAIPMHLVTHEAVGEYLRALSDDGLLLIHISNRFIELEPVLAAEARARGLAIAVRDDYPPASARLLTPSSWVAMSRSPARIAALRRADPDFAWQPPQRAAPRPWTDDHASILRYIRWENLLGTP